ncbi:unnamed protein product [Schistosoma guineensis]|nr:unnamed protein product [Schistosoma guineensis]
MRLSTVCNILCLTMLVTFIPAYTRSAGLPDIRNIHVDTFGQDESEQQFTQSPTEENGGDYDDDENEKLDKKMEYAIENDSVDENDHNIIMNININANEGHEKQPDNGDEIDTDFLQ